MSAEGRDPEPEPESPPEPERTDGHGRRTDSEAAIGPAELQDPAAHAQEAAEPPETGKASDLIEPAPLGRTPRRAVFSLEGRAAPGLYAAGWILTATGLVLLAVLIGQGVRGPAAIALLLAGAGGASLGLVAAAAAQGLQRRADGVEGYAGPSPFLVFAAVFFVGNLGVLPVLFAGGLLGFDITSPIGIVVDLLIMLAIYVGLIRLLVVGTGALGWSEMGLWPPGSDSRRLVSDLLSGVVLVVPALVVTTIVSAILVSIFGATPPPPLPPAHDVSTLAADLIAGSLLAPVGEELFFRGFATTAWERRLGRDAALVRGAIFFAFVHVLNVGGGTFGEAIRAAAVSFGARLPIGYLLGWLYLRRRSLYASLALHASFNGVLILAAWSSR